MACDKLWTTGSDFIKVMETFPCLFNIGVIKKPNCLRLRSITKRLEDSIQKEVEDFGGQRIKDLNVLSWIYFQVGEIDKAKSKNDDALCIDTNDLVALGNRAFLEWYSGNDLPSFLDHLKMLKLKPYFLDKSLNAKSVQADLLYHLGGIYNISSSIVMCKDLSQKRPENFEWKYFLCQAQRGLFSLLSGSQIQLRNEYEKRFREVAENATHAFFKSGAMSELACIINELDEVNELVSKSLDLYGDSPVVLRKCGKALAMQSQPRGIELLEKSNALKAHMVTKHSLAKALVNYRITQNMDRKECDKKAVLNFQEAYDLSCKENVRPLVDLAFLYLSRKRYEESFKIYRDLLHNWMVREVYQNPFVLSNIMSGWHKSLRMLRSQRTYPDFDRFSSMTIIVAIEQFKHRASPSIQTLTFDLIANPRSKMSHHDRSVQSLLDLMRDCIGDHYVLQTLVRLKLQGNLANQQFVKDKIELFLAEDQPGEALLLLDILELQENNHLDFSRKLRDKAMVQEARWQLNRGLVSCKLLFYKLFITRHLCSSWQWEGDTDDISHEADVLIFQDGYHWRPFLQDNSDQSSSDERSLWMENQDRMVEDVLINLFDLETITNPWLPFSGGNGPDPKEFSSMLRLFKVRMVLVVVDADTSNGFLQMTDFLLSKIYQAKETDVAIVYTKGVIEHTAKNHMPGLASNVRCFKADESGFQQGEDTRSITDLMGTEILDTYFSGRVDNAMEFFQFLAPGE